MSILEQMNQVFCLVFDDDSISIKPEMTANDIDGWDSLSHINLILAIESTFNIRFTQKELLSFKNIGDLSKSVEGKCGSAGA